MQTLRSHQRPPRLKSSFNKIPGDLYVPKSEKYTPDILLLSGQLILTGRGTTMWNNKRLVCVLVAQLCPTLSDPRAVACQAPLFMEFSKQEYWNGLPFPSPGDLSNPGTELVSPALQAESSPSKPPGKPSLENVKLGPSFWRTKFVTIYLILKHTFPLKENAIQEIYSPYKLIYMRRDL